MEAVLSCISAVGAHTSPYGQTGSRLSDAERALKEQWGYSLAGRTMLANVHKMLDMHKRKERIFDGESGIEHDREDVDVSKCVFLDSRIRCCDEQCGVGAN